MADRNSRKLIALLAAAFCAPLLGQEAEPQIVRGGSATVEARELDFSVPGNDPLPAVKATGAEQSPPGKSNASQPLKLPARSGDGKASAKPVVSKPIDSLITMGGSLCVVLSIFFGLAWLTRRGTPKHSGKLPGDVIELLGKAPLMKGQDLQLVRVGSKLLLLCVTPSGCETLTEITDEEEVDRLCAICRRNNPASVTAAFHQALTSLCREPAHGFTGSARTADRRGGRYA